MSGNLGSNLPLRPRFALDESLARPVAQALAHVNVPIASVIDIFGQQGMTDDQILDWCRRNDAVWIHADDTRHTKLLREGSAGARTVLIDRPRGVMSVPEQLRIVAVILPLLENAIEANPSQMQFIAGAASPLHAPVLSEPKL